MEEKKSRGFFWGINRLVGDLPGGLQRNLDDHAAQHQLPIHAVEEDLRLCGRRIGG